MSRDWLALYVSILGKPKYRRLSIPARAALFHVWLLAPGQAPEATWRTRDDLVELLELDGYDPSLLDELIARRWLDVEGDGIVAVHDWDEHQLSATKAIRDYWEAERKRTWRRERKSPPAPPSTETATSTGTVQESGPRPDASGRTTLRKLDDDVRTTCPGCGDGPLIDTDPNVAVANRAGQLRHLRCPSLVAVAS